MASCEFLSKKTSKETFLNRRVFDLGEAVRRQVQCVLTLTVSGIKNAS